MSAGKELFKLFGLIGMQGVETVEKDFKKIDKQVRKAQKEIDRFGKRVQGVGTFLTKALTAPIAAVSASIGALAIQTGKYADKILDLEQVTGLSTKRLQEYEHVARAAGVSFEGFVGVISKFQGRIPQFVAGQGRAAEAMEQLGVSVTNSDGSIRDINTLFPELLKRLNGVKDITQRNAIAQQIFGRSMNDLAPVLSLTADQIENITNEANDMGLILGKDALNDANNFRIEIEKLKAQVGAAGRSIASGFIPIIQNVLVPLVKDKIIPFFQAMTNRIKSVFEWWEKLSDQTKTTVKGFVLMAVALGPVVFGVGKLISLSKILVPLFAALATGTFSFSGAMAALQKSTLGVTLVIGSLVALGWYFYSQWDTISVQLIGIWHKLKLEFSKLAVHGTQLLTDFALSAIRMLSKVSGVIPGLTDKLQNAEISILKFKAALYRDLGKQQEYTNRVNESAAANKNFSETLKEAVEEGKKAIGIQKDLTEQTQFKTKAKKESKDATKDEAETERAFAEERIRFEKSVQDELDQMTLTELERFEKERAEKIAIAEQMGANVLAVENLYALKAAEYKKELRDQEEKEKKKAIQNDLRNATSFGNKINNILSKFSDNRLKKLDIEQDKKIKAIENSKMTEEQKEVAIQRIADETDKKRQKIERQKAMREKLAALFSIAINTASAIVEALPNLPLSIAIGVLGAGEAVAVASTPMPFEEGGLIKGSDTGINAIIGEKNKDEVVFPLEDGITSLVDGLIERISNIEFPAFPGLQAAAAAEAVPASVYNLNVGTLIGDERSYMTLERKLNTMRIAENQRKGL